MWINNFTEQNLMFHYIFEELWDTLQTCGLNLSPWDLRLAAARADVIKMQPSIIHWLFQFISNNQILTYILPAACGISRYLGRSTVGKVGMCSLFSIMCLKRKESWNVRCYSTEKCSTSDKSHRKVNLAWLTF